MSQSSQRPVGTASCLHKKRSSHWENANSWWNLPRVQQGQAVFPRKKKKPKHSSTSVVVHFFEDKNSLSKSQHLYFIVADNLWLVRRVAEGFNISGTANSHQRLKHKAEWTRQRNENTTWVFYLSSTATLTCLSPAQSRCSFYCRLKLQLQTLLKPLYSGDLNTSQAEHFFFCQTSLILNNSLADLYIGLRWLDSVFLASSEPYVRLFM